MRTITVTFTAAPINVNPTFPFSPHEYSETFSLQSWIQYISVHTVVLAEPIGEVRCENGGFIPSQHTSETRCSR